MSAPLDRELHAYADGRLEPGERQRITAWLKANPEQAARVRDWQRQNELLHHAYDAVLDEPLPQRWQARVARHRRWRPLATAAGWLVAGVAIGMLLGPLRRDAPAAAQLPLARQAAIAHAVYAPEVRHPVEVDASQEAHLLQWLSKRLGRPLYIPALGERGFALVGGRLLPGSEGPVAQFMYEDAQGRRLTLYVSAPEAGERESAFRYAVERGVGVFYWVDARFAYALVGELGREELLAHAESAYHQLEGRGTAP